jgi:hypothetical protein
MAGFCRRWPGLLALVIGPVIAGAVAACGGDPSGSGLPPPGGGHFIAVDVRDLSMPPMGSRVVLFRLRDAASRPVPNRVLNFEIMDVAEAGGAVLSLDAGVTDAYGRVWLQVIAGTATMAPFHVRVSSPRADEVMLSVIVDNVRRGRVEVVPELSPALAPADVDNIQLHLLRAQLCSEITPTRPPSGTPATIGPGTSYTFGAVSSEDTNAVLGEARDAADKVRARGCVDLPGPTVIEEETIRLPLPLAAPRPTPVGSYEATSVLMFFSQPSGAKAIIAAFDELSACDADPGRLWLDCTVDALTPASAADPLDCIPGPDDEAAFGGRLAARRGRTPPGAPPGSRCRGPLDSADRNSLEVQIEGMFAMQNPKLTQDLEALGTDVGSLVSAVQLKSTLHVGATSAPNLFQVDHVLDVLQLGEANAIVDLFSLGLPIRAQRLVPMTYTDNKAVFDRHSFTLRLGSAARLAFERTVLTRHGFANDVNSFVNGLFASAIYLDRGTPRKGCLALGALVCPLVGAPEGCLDEACPAGVSALGRNLQAVFSRLDGADLDFVIEGEAQVYDRDADGQVDSFGYRLPTTPPGLWTGFLRSEDETRLFIPFTAELMKPK